MAEAAIGRGRAAARALAARVVLDPDDADRQRQAALAYERIGDEVRACAHWRAAADRTSSDEDVYDPNRFKDDALGRPETRRAFRSILNLGLTEAFRALHAEAHLYSYWDYGRAFDDDEGLRIDHFLLSPQAADRLAACEIDREPRGREKASDHTPVVCEVKA